LVNYLIEFLSTFAVGKCLHHLLCHWLHLLFAFIMPTANNLISNCHCFCCFVFYFGTVTIGTVTIGTVTIGTVTIGTVTIGTVTIGTVTLPTCVNCC